MATPVVIGEQLDPPRYGESWSEEASRIFLAAFLEYEQRVEFANADGVVRRQAMGAIQLIPLHVQRCFARHFYERQEMTADELLIKLKQHARYTTAAGASVRMRAAVEIRRVVKMKSGEGNVKDRVMQVSSALERYFCENPSVDALYRARNGDYLPGPAESVSRALVDGISPPKFHTYVRNQMTYVDGWKKAPHVVLKKMIELAESWKIVEAHGYSSAGGSAPSGGRHGGSARVGGRHGQQPQKWQSSWRPTCFTCGEVGHKSDTCGKGRAQGATPNVARESSEARGGRQSGRGRSNRGRGGGRGGRHSTADGGASAATNTGSSGTSAGSTASSVSGRAVYVGDAGNSVGSAGAVCSQPPGQVGPTPGASSIAAPSSASSGYSASWSGWSADSMCTTPAAGAQPWRQVTLGAEQGHSAGRCGSCRSERGMFASGSFFGWVRRFVHVSRVLGFRVGSHFDRCWVAIPNVVALRGGSVAGSFRERA